ncbi:MAG: P-II family nitrogen regulator [Clostridiales bacterium]|nr:P-II family nitrogen regulator [Clostridiales bacterium]
MLTASLHMLITIVDRGKGESVAHLLRHEGVLLHHIALGNGTAHKGLLSLLGLQDTAKDVVISFIRSGVSRRALRRLSHALEIDLPGRGIAFTLPVGSIGGAQAMHYLMGEEVPASHEEGGITVEQEQIKNDLIITIVNRGYTDQVMDAALPAGARGGTVVHARGAGTEEASKFFGITIQPEKELVMILVDHEHKIPVMQAIVRGAGLGTEGRGIVFSMPVTDVMGIVRHQEDDNTEDEE